MLARRKHEGGCGPAGGWYCFLDTAESTRAIGRELGASLCTGKTLKPAYFGRVDKIIHVALLFLWRSFPNIRRICSGTWLEKQTLDSTIGLEHVANLVA